MHKVRDGRPRTGSEGTHSKFDKTANFIRTCGNRVPIPTKCPRSHKQHEISQFIKQLITDHKNIRHRINGWKRNWFIDIKNTTLFRHFIKKYLYHSRDMLVLFIFYFIKIHWLIFTTIHVRINANLHVKL